MGDRVILPSTVRKWQQRVLVPVEELIVVPPDADPQQAAMMAINPVTAALLLDQYVDLQPGDAVVYNAVRLALDVIGGSSAGRLLHLLSPKGKLVTYGVVSGKPMELPGSLLIWNQLTVEGFFEGHPHILPKIAPILHDLVKMIGPGGIRQSIAAIYPIDRVKEAVAHAVKAAEFF
jgi:NADPH:quinone reductase-like Zn-dependent oxidoreductase